MMVYVKNIFQKYTIYIKKPKYTISVVAHDNIKQKTKMDTAVCSLVTKSVTVQSADFSV